jgi:hypothetical protein
MFRVTDPDMSLTSSSGERLRSDLELHHLQRLPWKAYSYRRDWGSLIPNASLDHEQSIRRTLDFTSISTYFRVYFALFFVSVD